MRGTNLMSITGLLPVPAPKLDHRCLPAIILDGREAVSMISNAHICVCGFRLQEPCRTWNLPVASYVQAVQEHVPWAS